MDLLMFKDDILKDFRTIQISLDEKYAKADEYLSEKINKFDLKIKSFEKKIIELSNLIVTDNSIREKVEKLCQSEDDIRDTIFKRRAIFNEFEKKTKDDISRINNILTESVIYPGIIGNSCKFSSFHDFMDYVIQELAQLNLFKDKSGLDLGPFKRKIDTALETLKLQINHFCSKDFVNTTISQSEERIQSLLKVYDDRLQDTRVENSHYSFSLIKKTEEIAKQMEKLRKYQNQLLDVKHNEEIFNTYNNEINSIKNRINKINEILKELLSFHPSCKINFGNGNETAKKASKIVSGVKQYIKGNLNANELSTMKKFTYDK
jgi:ribosomal protein L11